MSAPAAPRTVAVFDFDGTLIRGDSFPHFLLLACGLVRLTAAALEGAIIALARKGFGAAAGDERTIIKQRLIARLLAGRKRGSFLRPAQRLRQHLRWNEAMRKALLDHHAQGHHILIATGALDLYIGEALRDVPHHAVLCTETGEARGRVTAELPQGNCVRQRKAERVAAYLRQHGPFETSYGYGNAPHDLPMLALLRHRILV